MVILEESLANLGAGQLRASVTIKVNDHMLSETFLQIGEDGIAPIDFLWVIDSSTSMRGLPGKLG